MLRYRKVYDLSEESHIKWRWVLGAVGTLIILINFSGCWRLATLVALWSILEIDHLININEELRISKYSGINDLIQRFLILYQVKKLLDDEINRISGIYQYERGKQIRVPYVNVYVDHRQGFKGYIEIEFLPEFNYFLNTEVICTQLTSQLNYLNDRYVVTGKRFSPTGNTIIFELEDLRVDNQIEILNRSDLKTINNKVILNQNHMIDWEKDYRAVISSYTIFKDHFYWI